MDDEKVDTPDKNQSGAADGSTLGETDGPALSETDGPALGEADGGDRVSKALDASPSADGRYRLVARRDSDDGEVTELSELFNAQNVEVGGRFISHFKPRGLTRGAFVIRAEPNHVYMVEPCAKGHDTTLNGQALTEAVRLRNGDELAVEDYTIRFVMVFEKAQVHARTAGTAAIVSIVACLLVLLFEIAAVFQLSRMVRNHRTMGLAVAQMKTLSTLDLVRRDSQRWLNRILAADEPDHRALVTVEFIQVELDRIARYLRANSNRLEPDQINAIYHDLTVYSDMLVKIKDGTLYPELETINSESILKNLIDLKPNGGMPAPQ